MNLAGEPGDRWLDAGCRTKSGAYKEREESPDTT
jgi:hypothetical protein